MTEFLSDEWFAALTSSAGATEAPADLDLTIEQVVEGSPGHRWQVQIRAGVVGVVRDPAREADVRIVTDAETAKGIQTGAISAQRAFLDGRLQIGGDVQALMKHRESLAQLGPALGLG